MPLVTVKQPDGTYAKITLEEFVRRQQTAVATTTTVAHSPAVASTRNDVPVVEKKQVVNDAPPPVPRAPQITTTASTTPKKDGVNGMVSQSAQSDSLVGKIPFTVPVEYMPRLTNCLELRIKHVRNDEQTKKILMGSYDEGGLALTAAQAEQALSLCARDEQVLVVNPVKPLATTAPVNTFKHEPRGMVSSVRQVVPVPSAVRETSPWGFDRGKINGEQGQKTRPVVTDITYKPMSIGPIEEIRTLTLTDFRRLSPVARDAALRLEQKFVNLKGESVVLYMEGLEAWRQCPLYQEFTDRLLYAILHRSALDSVLSKTKSITSDELDVLMDMEKRLTV